MLFSAIILHLFACIAPMVEQFHGKEEVILGIKVHITEYLDINVGV
jgi:hypothetical protein